MQHRIDEGRLGELMEESDDLQSDAIKGATAGLADYVEAAHEAASVRRRSGWGPVAGVTALAGAATLLSATPAWAQGNNDVATLQTAAALENLAVATYKTALTLPFIGGADANPVVKAFTTKTMSQHAEHAQAFNGATQKLGGQPQTGVPAKYKEVVDAAVPGIKGPADVVGLAITLENVAAETYVKDVGSVSTPELRQLFASIAGVESQHLAILYAVQALLSGGVPELIALPPDAPKLPAAAGSVGFPDSFFKTDMAAGPQDGAVK
jgi:hypothetical protein